MNTVDYTSRVTALRDAGLINPDGTHVCTCETETPAMPYGPDECAVHDASVSDYPMAYAAERIAAALAATTPGVTAYVESTGGNCATIYVGPDQHPGTQTLPVLSIGPGVWYSYDNATGDTGETFIGPCYDRFGDAAHGSLHATMPEDIADPVAWLVAEAARIYPAAAELPVVLTTWDEV